ncbi:hypothetical protein AURDEDRAFT_124924 [Auricularia subglabra TFB-10046 SS5]|nr:hypothetical protein AURDEDRAFT_124924 [Auricularia subglabra TFB-10046 SS5]
MSNLLEQPFAVRPMGPRVPPPPPLPVAVAPPVTMPPGNGFTYSPISMHDAQSPVRAGDDTQDRLDEIAAGVEEVRQAVGGIGERTAGLRPDDSQMLYDTNARGRETNGRIVDMAASIQSVLFQVGVLAVKQEETVRAVNNLTAFTNRLAVGINGEHDSPGTGVLRVLDDWVVVMRSVKTSIEQTVHETDQMLRQIDERVQRVEQKLESVNVGLGNVQQVRAPSVALPAAAVFHPQIGGRVATAGGSGSPAPPSYATFDPANPMRHL